MATRGIGIFGILLAVGGLLALRCAQKKNRAEAVTIAREVHRWEGEGGAVASSTGPRTTRGANGVNGTNGAHHPDANGEAWPFPRG
ncbi:hypothetical protein [Paraburkholderia flava]|uniref:hypothetical protein n=1 Tax=Paraburkholderia flava TaxID=2547393 RepID=UPI00105C9790|nr:hypothetical protein [Paraburkholderia flava]